MERKNGERRDLEAREHQLRRQEKSVEDKLNRYRTQVEQKRALLEDKFSKMKRECEVVDQEQSALSEQMKRCDDTIADLKQRASPHCLLRVLNDCRFTI